MEVVAVGGSPPIEQPDRSLKRITMTDQRTRIEEFEVSGEKIVETVMDLVHKGNIRRITIKNDDGKSLIEIPLTLGVVGAVLLPVWAAVGALAALVTKCTIVVEMVEE
jgi:hypothetical protein